MKKKILIIGYGNFGKLICKFFAEDLEVFVYDKNDLRTQKGVKKLKKIEDVEKMDFVVFAVPVQFLEDSVKEFKKFISVKTLILDVSSVKVFPLKILKKHFKKNEIIGTHPLWGPESIKQGYKNLIVVLTNISASAKSLALVSRYVKSKGFVVKKMSAQEHDKEMAIVQGLSHFVGFALKDFDLNEKSPLRTFAYREMIKLYKNTSNDSEELFKTIQNYNPYTKRIRKQFIKKVIEIDKNLEK